LVAIMSAGPRLPLDNSIFQPLDLRQRATTNSASLPNLLHEFVSCLDSRQFFKQQSFIDSPQKRLTC
jgi:hypothetical protein